MNWHSITPVEMCSLEKFEDLTKSETTDKDVPHAAAILKNVPVYETAGILTSENKSELLNEWNWVLSDGPGVLVFRSAFSDTELLDDITTTFTKIIERENLSAKDKGDHFAETGANGRLWNSHEKLCMERTDLFIRYCANEIIAMISRSWLGPAYQITAQVNIVHPGGKAQVCHRDYHLGFLPSEQLTQFPINAHRLSASLTLQGAVAHSDMPLETGPTKFLPFSQKYDLGYLAVHQPQFQDFFEVNYIQLHLKKGDAVFFNPALFHAAGENITSDRLRIANLLQINSPFGLPTEYVDYGNICRLVFEPMKEIKAVKTFNSEKIENVIAASAKGYPFPKNLDNLSPEDILYPPSQQDILRCAIDENWEISRLVDRLKEAH